MAVAVSMLEGSSSLGLGALGEATRCLAPGVGVALRCVGDCTDERVPGVGEQGTMAAAEPKAAELSTLFGVEGGSLFPAGVCTMCWRIGEVGRQTRPLLAS